MLRRTKSSSLLPIVRLTNYFYPDSTGTDHVKELGLSMTNTPDGGEMQVYPGPGSSTPPPDYEQLYLAIQRGTFEGIEDERVRKKYACQGRHFSYPD